MRMRSLLTAAVAVAASASLSLAGTVIATFNGVNPGQGVGALETSLGSIGTTAGVFNWTRTGGTHVGAPTGNFTSFCIELNQNISTGNSYTYNVINLADAPNPGLPVPGVNGMGAAKASDIKKLWAAYRSSVVGATTAAAFQVAVWEIVYETTSTYSVSNGSGNFYLTNAAGVVAQANTWLSSLGSLTAEANLAALSNDDYQDQVVAVPLPPAVLAGMGLMTVMGVGYVRRSLANRSI